MWIEQLDEAAGAGGRLFVVTGACSGGEQVRGGGRARVDTQRLHGAEDLPLVSDERHAELDQVGRRQRRRVVDREDAGGREPRRVAVHLDAGQPVGHRLRRRPPRTSVRLGVITACQQQLSTLPRPASPHQQRPATSLLNVSDVDFSFSFILLNSYLLAPCGRFS